MNKRDKRKIKIFDELASQFDDMIVDMIKNGYSKSEIWESLEKEPGHDSAYQIYYTFLNLYKKDRGI